MVSPVWCNPLYRAAARVVVYSLFAGLLMLGCVATADAQIPKEAIPHKREALAAWRSVWGLNAPTASFAAQVHQESSWDVNARSYVGALGLTQFMPATAADIQARYAHAFLGLTMYSPAWAFRAQALYLKELYDRLQGRDNCERMAFAMSAYNGGMGRVIKRKSKSAFPDVCFNATCEINPGISASNQRENVDYPIRILKIIEPRYRAALWGGGSCG